MRLNHAIHLNYITMTRILIIDDDSAVRSATKLLLDAHGFEAVAVADGHAGVAAVQTAHFDLALVDLFMRSLDGLETTKALHRCKPDLPIIIVSGFMFTELPLEMANFNAMALEVGAVSTLYKPLRPRELLEAIKNVIGTNA
jgi:CheY-like chemotaxis protein